MWVGGEGGEGIYMYAWGGGDVYVCVRACMRVSACV